LTKYFDVANKTSANTELKTATCALFYEKNSYHFFRFGFLSNAFNSDADGSTRLGTGSKLAITRSKKTTRARVEEGRRQRAEGRRFNLEGDSAAQLGNW
jgi:hypothetical protein